VKRKKRGSAPDGGGGRTGRKRGKVTPLSVVVRRASATGEVQPLPSHTEDEECQEYFLGKEMLFEAQSKSWLRATKRPGVYQSAQVRSESASKSERGSAKRIKTFAIHNTTKGADDPPTRTRRGRSEDATGTRKSLRE